MKSGISRIIVAVDYSTGSKSACLQGRRLAERTGSELIPVHIIEEDIFASLGELDAEERNRVIDEARRRLEGWLTEIGAGSYGRSSCVRIGHPVATLAEMATEGPRTLLVLGYSGFNHRPGGRLGTIAAQCVRRVPVDVLVVRPGHEGAFRKVTVGCDFSESARHALARAFVVAAIDGAILNCIHVRAWLTRPEGGHPLGYGGRPPTLERELVDADRVRLGELTAPLRADHPEVDCRVFAESRPTVAHSLVEFLESTESDLAVLSIHGQGGLKEFFIGSTAERLLRDAPCSVWVAKGLESASAVSRS